MAGRSFLIKKNYVIDFGILNRAFSFLHIVKAAFDPSIETKFVSKYASDFFWGDGFPKTIQQPRKLSPLRNAVYLISEQADTSSTRGRIDLTPISRTLINCFKLKIAFPSQYP